MDTPQLPGGVAKSDDDPAEHHRRADRLLSASVRDLSLVDAASLEIMRDQGIDRVFAFDAHLAGDGAQSVP
jgi:predicted nucleic acid-binding protein